MFEYHRYVRTLGIVFLIFWTALAIQPLNRQDWILENLLMIPVTGMVVWGYRNHLFTRLGFTLIFLFCILHGIGAHYTYSQVPYDVWWTSWFGHPFNDYFGWERNHFDRLVHFSYGLLIAYPIRELFLRVAKVRGFWGYFLPLDVTLSTSGFYELVEWVVVEVLGGEAGMEYLGSQGDIWDAQKDMALASTGALIAILITAVINIRCQRDFTHEWLESLEVDPNEPDHL